MTVKDATQTLEQHARQELTKAASEYFADLLKKFNIVHGGQNGIL